jgi:esterase/lipase
MQPYAILLIHGFGGGLWELAPLEQDLNTLGFCCRSFTLPGHDENGRIHDIHSAEPFGNAVLKEYDLLSLQGLPVIVIGFSMGALLAAWLDSVRSPKSLVLINTPIDIGQPMAVLHWLKADAEHKNLRYTQMMLQNALRQRPEVNLLFLKVRKRFLPALKHVKVPVFLAQSQWDETVQPRSVKKAAEMLKSDKITLQIYPNSRHHLCDGPDYPQFLQDLLAFF